LRFDFSLFSIVSLYLSSKLFILFIVSDLSSSKKSGKGKRPGKGGNRFWKNIGLGFKTPREAIDGMFKLLTRYNR